MKILFSDIEKQESKNRARIMRQVEELRYEVFSLIESTIDELNNKLPSLAKRPIKLSTSNNNVFHAIPKNECYEIEIGYKGMMELLSYAELIADELYEITKIEFNKHSEAFFQIWLMAIIFHEISHILRGHNDYPRDRMNSRRYQAFESDADADSFQSTFFIFNSLPKVQELFSDTGYLTPPEKIIELFGYIFTYYFNFLQINSSSDDCNHQKPIIRRFYTISSNEKVVHFFLEKSKLPHTKERINTLKRFIICKLFSSFKKIMEYNNEKINMEDIINSAIWMSELDNILKESEIFSYNKIKDQK